MYSEFLTNEVYVYFRHWINNFIFIFIIRYNDLNIYYLPVGIFYYLFHLSINFCFTQTKYYVLIVIYYMLYNY